MSYIKRFLVFFMVAVLLLSMVPTALGAEEEDEAVYVLNYGVKDDPYTGPDKEYFSPYLVNYLYDDAPNSYHQVYMFALYNTVTGKVVPTYCTDILIGARVENRYRRLNLEDSTFAAGSAGRLRAIVKNGFYVTERDGESAEEHANRVWEDVRSLGNACGVPDLTLGEAISATQLAIWKAAHGSQLEYTDFVSTIYTGKATSAYRYYDLCDVERANGKMLQTLINEGITPVMAPLTHDGKGNILNTNADTIASETAKALAPYYDVTLIYSFEKKGVLSNPENDDSVIPVITHADFERYKADGTVAGGMIPKLENALAAIDAGVKEVIITLATAIDGKHGTVIK